MIYVTLDDSKEAFFGINSIERLIEATGQTAALSELVEKYLSMAAQQEIRHAMARPDMGYRVLP
jgi:hypothetical protein